MSFMLSGVGHIQFLEAHSETSLTKKLSLPT